MAYMWCLLYLVTLLVTACCGTAIQQAQDKPSQAPSDLRHPRRTLPVRHEDPASGGVPVGNAAPSQCPPPMPFSRELCGAPACLHRCPTGRACCFNGCVHTCLFVVESPPVIDWIEDTSAHISILDDSSSPGLPVRYEDPAFAEGREEMVHLPGGCTLSGKQYAELQTFMEAPSIEKCMCEKGEVVCSVKMFKT